MGSIEGVPTIGDIAASRHQMGLWSCMSYVIGMTFFFKNLLFQVVNLC